MPQARRAVAKGPFLGVVVAILATGLLCLLGLNTLLAQGSFHVHALQVSNKQLADREQVLQHEVDALQAPAALAAEAQAQGMVPAGPPVFLRLPEGAVLGEAAPAVAPPPPLVDVPSPPATAGTAAPSKAAPAASGDKTASDKTASDKTASDKTASDKTASDKTASDKRIPSSQPRAATSTAGQASR